jgi:hypothetical protein
VGVLLVCVAGGQYLRVTEVAVNFLHVMCDKNCLFLHEGNLFDGSLDSRVHSQCW